jgi:hypothetical protein
MKTLYESVKRQERCKRQKRVQKDFVFKQSRAKKKKKKFSGYFELKAHRKLSTQSCGHIATAPMGWIRYQRAFDDGYVSPTLSAVT